MRIVYKKLKTEEISWDWDEANGTFEFLQSIFYEKLQPKFDVLKKNPWDAKSTPLRLRRD